MSLSSHEEGMTEDVFAGVFSGFVEAVHVKLSDEAVNIPMSEVFGQDLILKVINFFDGKLTTVGHPVDDSLILLIFQYFKALLYEIGDRILSLVTHHVLKNLISII